MMKKTVSVLALGAALMFGMPAMAQQRCSYSPLQDAVRSANNASEIERLVQRRVNLNAPVRCGGSLVQLAVLRGNTDVLKVLLENGANAKDMVKPSEFDMQGLPQEIPLVFFAAYRAPNAATLKMLIDSGHDFMGVDQNGENISWYLEQNPVLRETPLAKEIDEMLLFQTSEPEKKETAAAAPALNGGQQAESAPAEPQDATAGLRQGNF